MFEIHQTDQVHCGCADDSQVERYQDEQNRLKRKAEEPVPCARNGCANTFIRGRNGGSKRKYCSPKCQSLQYSQVTDPTKPSLAQRMEVLDVDLSNPSTIHTSKDGYVRMIWHGTGWDMAHRIVLAHKLGRPLRERESAHHKNGLRHDNSFENLELWVGPVRNGVRGYDLECPHCNKRYYDEAT
jgi:hypothetical protein